MYPGVDIVYLPYAFQKKRSTDSRYKEIVFHPSEISFIDSAADPELLVHVFWAAKEAIYKSYVRNEVTSFRFIPHHITILEFYPEAEGEKYFFRGKIKDQVLPVAVTITADHILAVIAIDVKTELLSVEGISKTEVRTRLGERSAELQHTAIEKLYFSYSHDGPYAAISYGAVPG